MSQSEPNADGRDMFEAIGRAVVAFEQVTHRLQVGIATILAEHGLRNQQLANVVLAELTAAPLISMYRTLLFEVMAPDTAGAKYLKQIFSRLVRLTERRNEIVHSTWFVGWAEDRR